MIDYYKILSGLMGVAVGDALGVPVEFQSREDLDKDPITNMRGYGSHNQPPGTWSDDSSLTFCLAEAIYEEGFSDNFLNAIGTFFLHYYKNAYWTPHGKVFDIGGTTLEAIRNIESGIPAIFAGNYEEKSNGNGSLMRTLPMAFCYHIKKDKELIDLTHDVSAITHAHPRSQMACGIYVSIAINLLKGESSQTAYREGIQRAKFIYQAPYFKKELPNFDRVMSGSLTNLSRDEVKSSGYVIDTLEASLWCFLNSSSYEEAVMMAVNLGGDTDTTAAVTGGLAGIYYGYDNIPSQWIETIARKDDIIDLGNRLALKLKTYL